jgi:hypothetical protein
VSTQPTDDPRDDPFVPHDAPGPGSGSESAPAEGTAPTEAGPAVTEGGEAEPEAGSRRSRLFRRAPREAALPPPPPVESPPAEAATEVIPAPEKPTPPAQLRKQRRELMDRREDVVYHLGGLAYELHRRDMLEERVMRIRADMVAGIDAQVRDIDARIEEMERARREKRDDRRKRPASEPEPLGYCTVCGSPYIQQEARFCWSCGSPLERDDLKPAAEGGAPDGDDQPTTVIDEPPEHRT